MVNVVKDLFSKRLRRLREESGLTMVELAGILGMSQATISEWEKGNKFPRAAALQGLANHFDVPMEYFFKEKVFLVTEMVNIPLHPTILQSAVSNNDDVLDEDVKQIKLPTSLLGSYADEENLDAFLVPGDSMNHLFPEDSTIVVKEIGQADLVDEDIVIYIFDGKYAIGRFRRNDAGKVFLFKPESTNALLYDIVVPFEKIQNVKIVAKVIWYGVLI
ncbi:XRE family transcriptional regulator [Sporosarcina siberiensis]|uniref:XRE family transcriptional regulator n=1 Tax=Sporosarcina siberiensis TaxID=1365606 RepID=A0ABW4SIA8_9BACL